MNNTKDYRVLMNFYDSVRSLVIANTFLILQRICYIQSLLYVLVHCATQVAYLRLISLCFAALETVHPLCSCFVFFLLVIYVKACST